MAKNNPDDSKKLGIKGVLAIGVGGLLVLVFLATYYGTTAARQVPSSTPDVTVFQTGGGSVVFAVLLTAFGFLILAFGCWVVFQSFGDAKQTTLKDIGDGLLMVCGFLLLGGGTVWYNGVRPYSVRVSIDESGQVISIDKYHLLRKSQDLSILFDEIEHITYRYQEGQPPTGQYDSGYPAKGSVEITKCDGTTVGVSEAETPDAQLRVAEAIAEATGKPLRRE